MTQKFIVKSLLSSLKAVDLAPMQELESLLFAGSIREDKDLPSKLSKTLRSDERSFLLEKATQIRGNPARLLELLKDLPNQAPKTTVELAVWEERAFLRGFAHSRLNQTQEASAWFEQLPRRFAGRIQIERALQRTNRGDFHGAETLFRGVIDTSHSDLDAYSVCTLLGGYCLSLMHKGDFRSAKRCLEERKRILKTVGSPVLSFGTGLYEILLCLEKHEYDRAAALIANALTDQERISVNGFFLLHLELRLNLARGLLNQAGQTLEELKRVSLALKMPEGVLDFRLEEVEWKLRSRVFDEALDHIVRLEAEARAKGDEFLLFRIAVIKAQALCMQGQYSESLREIQKAISVAENKGYQPGLSWALFHAAGIARMAKEDVTGKLFLQRGRRLCAELGLRGRETCFIYMLEVIENRHATASVLIALAKYQEIGPEIEYFLDNYRYMESAGFVVTDGKKRSSVLEPNLRRMFFKEPAVFCFSREALLIANLGAGQMRSAEFESASPLLPVFRLFLEAFQTASGIGLAAIHESRSPHKYDEYLHAPATKMLLSRLRDKFKTCGLSIRYDRNSQLYSLHSELSLLVIRGAQDAPASDTKMRTQTREEALLERIASESFVSTHELCQEFKVSRQALHPILKKLVEKRKIRVVRRGPISGYVYTGKR